MQLMDQIAFLVPY